MVDYLKLPWYLIAYMAWTMYIAFIALLVKFERKPKLPKALLLSSFLRNSK